MFRFMSFVGLTAALLVTGCSMDKLEPPAISGPSGFGLSVTMTASPDTLPRDGSSTSTIQLLARGADGKPLAGQRFQVTASGGTLSESDVVTDGAGQKTFGFIAPGLTDDVSVVEITAIAVGTNFDNTVPRRVLSVRVVGPDFPVPSFVFTPSTPAQYELVTFDASASTLSGAGCSASCSYVWDFGDGTIGNGKLIAHRFESRGTFPVTLTMTTSAGTFETLTKTVVVGAPQALIVDIKFSPTEATIGTTVLFDGRDSKTPDGVAIVGYEWDFGTSAVAEGRFGDGATAPATFQQAGTYVVRLTITDAVGRTGSKTATVEIVPAP